MSARHFAITLLAGLTLLMALGVVQSRHRHRQLFMELSRLEQARDEMNIEFGRLQLELGTIGATDRVEREARARLGMRPPLADEQRLVILP